MKRQKLQEGIGILVTVIVIAAVAIIGGLTVYFMKKQTTAPATTMVPSTTTTTTGVTPTPSFKLTSGTTDANLDADSQDVSTKLKALNTDSASIDQGLNDQQGNLSEQ